MTLQTFVSILCLAVLLLVCAVSAGGTESTADGSITMRASTSGGSHLLQAAGASGAPVDMEQPSWAGSIVLIFGGFLGGLWLLVGALSTLRGLRDFRANALARPQRLPPSAGRGRKDETSPVDSF